jgi:hypothetical protein
LVPRSLQGQKVFRRDAVNRAIVEALYRTPVLLKGRSRCLARLPDAQIAIGLRDSIRDIIERRIKLPAGCLVFGTRFF